MVKGNSRKHTKYILVKITTSAYKESVKSWLEKEPAVEFTWWMQDGRPPIKNLEWFDLGSHANWDIKLTSPMFVLLDWASFV